MPTRNAIKHFSHNHPLTEVNGVGTYTCNGCKLYGQGKTYRCSDCDYDLHEYCATCPQSLINSCHAPSHELTLINGPKHMTERGCYVCRVYIQGMFYKCKHCSFESHPLCTHVPTNVSSPNATMTKQRSFHDHAGQPSSPHHPHMGPFGQYPYGDHTFQPQQHPYMNPGSPNPGSPKADHNSGPSTPKSKKKTKSGLGKAMKAALSVTGMVIISTITGGVWSGEEFIGYSTGEEFACSTGEEEVTCSAGEEVTN